MKTLGYALIAIATVAASAPNAALASKPIVHDVRCHRTAPSHDYPPTRVLIVGESWASGGKMLPHLPESMAKKAGPVLACSIGYSGMNTRRIKQALTAGGMEKAKTALGGRPAIILVLTGVNDQVQHIGQKRHAEDVRALNNYLARHGGRVAFTSPPYISDVDRAWLPGRLKHLVNRYLCDGGRKNVSDEYASAARATGADLIQYRPFLSSYVAGRYCYASDGIHLTAACYPRYARYLGVEVGLRMIGEKRS